MALLSVRDLHVRFPGRFGQRDVQAVDGIALEVEASQAVGLVGESGCGKTVAALAMLGLLQRSRAHVSGSVVFDGRSLLGLPSPVLRRVRGREVAIVFQDPVTALNPVLTVGRQVGEVLEEHFGRTRAHARREAVALLERIESDTLLDAIADGTFGIMRRPADRGKGLDGVAGHEDGYYNPATELLEAAA